jgi:hypothetical protein
MRPISWYLAMIPQAVVSKIARKLGRGRFGGIPEHAL